MRAVQFEGEMGTLKKNLQTMLTEKLTYDQRVVVSAVLENLDAEMKTWREAVPCDAVEPMRWRK